MVAAQSVERGQWRGQNRKIQGPRTLDRKAAINRRDVPIVKKKQRKKDIKLG